MEVGVKPYFHDLGIRCQFDLMFRVIVAGSQIRFNESAVQNDGRNLFNE